MRVSPPIVASLALAGCLLTAGCSRKQTPDELRRETAHATTVAKEDTKAVVQGVRDGLKSDGPKNGKPLDLNDASKGELTDLPGISSEQANQIIAGRPYRSSGELVSRHILSQADYDRIKDQVQVEKPTAGK